MFENWFINRCMTLVGNNGRRLQGKAMEQAEAALNEAKLAGFKVWADKNGLVFKKAHGLFSQSEPLFDAEGNRLRICGNPVHIRTNFCSKCSGDAPGGWWRCGECGKPVGNETMVCPHCGHHMNPTIQSDISTGSWIQREGVFAERFDLADVNVLLPHGLNIQENQRGLFLEGGELTMIMTPGHYACEDFCSDDVKQYGAHAIVFVDMGEFSLPLQVIGVYTKENMKCDVHLQLTLQFDPDNGNSFLCNLMRNRLVFEVGDACPVVLGTDEIKQILFQTTDDIVRHFCVDKAIYSLFKSADTRVNLELEIMKKLAGQMHSLGLRLVRLGELEFKSETFNELRDMDGQVEITRRKNEYMLAADKIANDAILRNAISEKEMENYMATLAQKAQISAGQRDLEMKRIRRKWEYEDKLDAMTRDYNLNMETLAQASRLTKEQMAEKSETEMRQLVDSYNLKDEEQRREAQFRLQKINDDIKELDTRHAAELRRLLEDEQNEYDRKLIEEKVNEVERRVKEADAMLGYRLEREKDKLEQERKRAKIAIYKEWEFAQIEVTKKWTEVAAEADRIEDDRKDRDIDREIRLKDAEAERLIKLKNAETDRMVRAAQGMNGMSLFAIIAATADPSTREKLVEVHLGEIERRMKPEVLLAAMAKRGNDEAQAKIDRMDKEHREHLEKTVLDNRQMYETVMQMTEKTFNQMMLQMSRSNSGGNSTTHDSK